MADHQLQSELSEQLRTWAASETYEDSREQLHRLAAEYEKLAAEVSERLARRNRRAAA
jgi:hypothetical protein